MTLNTELADAANTSTNIHDSILDTVGRTPVVRLSRLVRHADLKIDLLAKVESFNPASSIKDRSALAMIEHMESSGEIGPGTQLVEATSGNNGIACAWICAIKNIPLTIVMPEHMSIERRKIQALFGANLVLTPRALGTKGAIDRANDIVAGNENAVLLGQFKNPANPDVHEATTAKELWDDTGGKVDVIIAGVGTGGTIMGLSRCFKSRNPDVQVIAVEPASCPVLSKGLSGVHKIQGLSSGHVPDILDRRALDEVITIEDAEAIAAARLLPVLEGISAGISSGAAVAAALKVGRRKELEGKTVAIILADAADRYISTELFDGLAEPSAPQTCRVDEMKKARSRLERT